MDDEILLSGITEINKSLKVIIRLLLEQWKINNSESKPELFLAELDYLTQKEIADIVGKDPSTISKNLKKARK